MGVNKPEEAWIDGAGADYSRGSLVSEVSLQASLYYHLRQLLNQSHTLAVRRGVIGKIE